MFLEKCFHFLNLVFFKKKKKKRGNKRVHSGFLVLLDFLKHKKFLKNKNKTGLSFCYKRLKSVFYSVSS